MTSLADQNPTKNDSEHSVIILGDNDSEEKTSSEETAEKSDNRELREELRRLKCENETLKNELKCVVALYEDDSSTKMPLIQVTFKNEALAQNYKAEIETFLHNLLAKENDEKCSAQDDKTFQLQIYQDFCIDSVPDLNENDSEVWDVPLYNHSYKDILDQNGNSEKLTFIRCFNCLGNHFLDKCPEVLDRQRIAYNRKFFFGINNRYNLKGPLQQVKQFQPGAISKELRDALDLKDDQLPQYIYKMRILGYPPGWLKEAEISNSELAMYDCQGKVKLYEENIQNGSDSENHEVKYDSEKIFEYPGFNVPVPPGFVDEHEEIGMPPIQPYHLMDINATNSESLPYTKRKFPNQYEKNKRLKSDEIEEVDMDIENIDQGRIIYSDDEEAHLCKFIPPLPHDTLAQIPMPPPPPPPPLSDDPPAFAEEAQICANVLSPTLTELEEEKQRLMNELELELEDNKKDMTDETENINNCDKHETSNEVPHIILIGDYIFKNLCIKNENWKIDIYANNNWKLRNVLEYIKLEISNLTGEEIIFIHLGINDFLSRGSSSLSEICSTVKDSLNEIRTQVKILILSAILPFPHFDTVVNHKIQCLNMFIRELCKKSNLGFINLRKAFMNGNLLKSDLFEDQQYYLNENGSKIMCDVLLKNFEFAVSKSKDVSFKQEISCQETIEWFN